VLERLFGHPALSVPRFIAVVSVATGVAGKHVDEGAALVQLIEAEVKEACPLAVDNRNTQLRLSPEQLGQGPQLESDWT